MPDGLRLGPRGSSIVEGESELIVWLIERIIDRVEEARRPATNRKSGLVVSTTGPMVDVKDRFTSIGNRLAQLFHEILCLGGIARTQSCGIGVFRLGAEVGVGLLETVGRKILTGSIFLDLATGRQRAAQPVE